MSEALREFSEKHIDEDCRELTGDHDNGLFFNCVFHKLNNLTLKHCDLNRSQFTTDQVRDALGFTVTLDCMSFRNVELSPLVFDLILCLLTTTKGNDDARRRLLDVIGPKAIELKRIMNWLEQ